MRKVFTLLLALMMVCAMASAESFEAISDYATSQGFSVGHEAPFSTEDIPDMAWCGYFESSMMIGDASIPLCFVIWNKDDSFCGISGVDNASELFEGAKGFAQTRQLFLDICGMYDWDLVYYGNDESMLFSYCVSAYIDQFSENHDSGIIYDSIDDFIASVSEYIQYAN